MDKKAKETNLSIDWLIEQILDGKITKSNILLTNKYYAIYGQHKRKINEALETAGERKSYRTIAELEAGKFKKTILYIHAVSGAGKTRYGKKLIHLFQDTALSFGETWDFCVTASTNAFDEYNGQEILFLDDVKGNSLTVSDWLKLLDPYMISPISARYHNKMGSAKVIIITNTKEPISFFEKSKGSLGEDLGQFVRRIDYLVEIKDNFHLSIPLKQKYQPQILNHDYYDNPQYSYDFSKMGEYSMDTATDEIVKKLIHNLQWKKQNELSPNPSNLLKTT